MIETEDIPQTDHSPITIPDLTEQQKDQGFEDPYELLNAAHMNDRKNDAKKDKTLPTEDELVSQKQAELDSLDFFKKESKRPSNRAMLNRLKASLQRPEYPFRKEQDKLYFDQLTDSNLGNRFEDDKPNIPDLGKEKQNIEKNVEDNLEKMDDQDDLTNKLLDVLNLATNQSDINKVIEEAKEQYTNRKIRKENLDKIIEIAERQTHTIQEKIVKKYSIELSTTETIVGLSLILGRANEELGNKIIEDSSFQIIKENYNIEKKQRQTRNLEFLIYDIDDAKSVKELKIVLERAHKYADLGSIDAQTDLQKVLDQIYDQITEIQELNAQHIMDMIVMSNYSEALLKIQDYIQLNALNDEISMRRNAPVLYDKLNKRMAELKEREK